MSLIHFSDELILKALSKTNPKTTFEVAQSVTKPTKRGIRVIATSTARTRLERLKRAGKVIKAECHYGRQGCKWLRAE